MRRINSEIQEFIDADIVMLVAPWFTLEQSLGDAVVEKARDALEEIQINTNRL